MSYQELIGFLESSSEEIAKIALENVLPITPASANQAGVFKENGFRGLNALTKLAVSSKDGWITQNATIALVNLTDDEAIRNHLANDKKAPVELAKQLVLSPKPTHTRYTAMLLNNISREPQVLKAIQGTLLTTLVLTTSKPGNVSDEDFDFLTFAFSEFARQDAPVLAKLLPHMYVQLSSNSLNRRKALAAVIKNALFDVKVHGPLSTDTPLIEAIMIRLRGSEALDEEDTAKLPPAVRNESSPTKQREPDINVILMLVEGLLLLSSSQIGREMLRRKHTYLIIRELHRTTKDPSVTMACENFANMVLRGDPSESGASVDADGMIVDSEGQAEQPAEDLIEEVV